ncbi:galactose-1-phosphate uridylyltransferase [Nanoarchaeota archaeon]
MELRKDYILDRWVILATARAKRPHQFKLEKKTEPPKTDFFAPGNEHLTPTEIMRVVDENNHDNWKIRVFPNKFAAVEPEGNSEIKTDNTFFTFSDAYGHHEVVVETPDDRQLWDLSEDEIHSVLKVYSERIKALSSDPNIKYACVFKNSGKEAGTSIVHSHSQIISYNKVPETVQQEINAVANFETCPYCDIINIEKDSSRRCFENDNFVAFTPYCSRFPFEIWVFPKQHLTNITEMNNDQIDQMAEIMKNILVKLKELNAPFNYVLHYSPQGENLHFHVEILPRLSTWAGFEMNGTIINTMTPETAAEFYRGETPPEEEK